jgi:hypothetical protein
MMVSTDPSHATVLHQLVSPARQCPSTRLSHGIRRPRVYTNGTVCYSMLTTTGEPSHLNEAFHDSNWKAAMDTEFDGLVQNKTWHLVPPQKAPMSLVASGYIKSRGKQMRVLIAIELGWLLKTLNNNME